MFEMGINEIQRTKKKKDRPTKQFWLTGCIRGKRPIIVFLWWFNLRAAICPSLEETSLQREGSVGPDLQTNISRATSCLPPTLFGLPRVQAREEGGEEGEKREINRDCCVRERERVNEEEEEARWGVLLFQHKSGKTAEFLQSHSGLFLGSVSSFRVCMMSRIIKT